MEERKSVSALAAFPNISRQRWKTMMATKSPERQIYDVFVKAIKEGNVPLGYYGPETCRWASQEEMERFSLKDIPLVHLDEKGDIDCYFTETEAVTISPKKREGIEAWKILKRLFAEHFTVAKKMEF